MYNILLNNIHVHTIQNISQHNKMYDMSKKILGVVHWPTLYLRTTDQVEWKESGAQTFVLGI